MLLFGLKTHFKKIFLCKKIVDVDSRGPNLLGQEILWRLWGEAKLILTLMLQGHASYGPSGIYFSMNNWKCNENLSYLWESLLLLFNFLDETFMIIFMIWGLRGCLSFIFRLIKMSLNFSGIKLMWKYFKLINQRIYYFMIHRKNKS